MAAHFQPKAALNACHQFDVALPTSMWQHAVTDFAARQSTMAAILYQDIALFTPLRNKTCMNRPATFSLKLFYCLSLLSVIVPIGLAISGWVRLSTVNSLFELMTAVGSIFIALGLYRALLVARIAGTLDSRPVAGVATGLRAIGIFCLYLGGVVGTLSLLSPTLMHMLVKSPSDNGIEFIVVGVSLAQGGGIGILGLFLFEFSRLLAFERDAREAF